MGNRIKLRRKELRIKQSELAEKLDISNNHISSIENGRNDDIELVRQFVEIPVNRNKKSWNDNHYV